MTNTEYRLSQARARLAEALEAGEPTAELRQAILLLERQLAEAQDAIEAQAAERTQARAEAIHSRTAELVAEAAQAIFQSAERFSLDH